MLLVQTRRRVTALELNRSRFDLTGNSFDLAMVPAPDLDTLPESGLGLYIIRSFMDDVKYLAGTPNVLSMTKYLDPGSRPANKPSDSFEDSSGGDSRQ